MSRPIDEQPVHWMTLIWLSGFVCILETCVKILE